MLFVQGEPCSMVPNVLLHRSIGFESMWLLYVKGRGGLSVLLCVSNQYRLRVASLPCAGLLSAVLCLWRLRGTSQRPKTHLSRVLAIPGKSMYLVLGDACPDTEGVCAFLSGLYWRIEIQFEV